MTEIKVIFSTTDPESRIIELSTETWNHIRSGHPEITAVYKVRETIKKPDYIIQRTSRRSLVYSRLSSSSLHTNVIARMDDNYEKGSVKTAYVSGQLPKGEIIWASTT